MNGFQAGVGDRVRLPDRELTPDRNATALVEDPRTMFTALASNACKLVIILRGFELKEK